MTPRRAESQSSNVDASHFNVMLKQLSGCKATTTKKKENSAHMAENRYSQLSECIKLTCQIIELLGSEGCGQSPAGPLDAQVGGGALDQGAAHDRVLQVGEQSKNPIGMCHGSRSSSSDKPLCLKFTAVVMYFPGRGEAAGSSG